MRSRQRFSLSALLGLFIMAILGGGILIVEAFSLKAWVGITTPVNIGIVILNIHLDIFFRYWLKTFTVKGREVADQSAMFLKYLTEASHSGACHQRDFTDHPESTPELFHKYFPMSWRLMWA
jgi:hypothetical protein